MNELGMRIALTIAAICLIAAPAQGGKVPATREGTSFSVSFPSARGAAPLDGRVILLVSGD